MNPPLPLEITWEELRDARASETKPRIIDCREADEWEICHLDDVQLVPLSQFAELAPARLGTNHDQWIVVYCHHGVRSMRATQWLRHQGYTRTQSLRGGIDLWADCVDPGMRKY